MFRNILLPVDVVHPERAVEMIAAAQKLADDGADFVLFNVIHAMPAMADFALPEEYTKMATDKSRETLEKILADNNMNAAIKLCVGQPASEILEFQKDHDIDLIVIGSHRPGLQDYLLGSTAARVVRHAQCPVLVLR